MLIFYLSILETQEDKNSFEDLYLKYGDSVLRYAQSQIHHQYNAEDVAHDTWLYMAEHFEKIRGADELSAKNYIMKIVHHKCIDLFRKQKTEIDFLEDLKGKNAEMMTLDEDEIFLSCCRKEEKEKIILCIKQLDTCYRDILNLYYMYEHKTAEIAKILRMKDGTVRQRLSRGRQQLLILLKENGLEYDCR